MIIILQRCGQKLDHAAPACELYQSALFKKSLQWARSLVPDKNIYIASALHGLLKCKQVIAPYDCVLQGSAGVAHGTLVVDPLRWAQNVNPQLQSLRKRDPDIVFTCGKSYVKYLAGPIKYPWGNNDNFGISKRLGWFHKNTPR